MYANCCGVCLCLKLCFIFFLTFSTSGHVMQILLVVDLLFWLFVFF